MRYKKLTLLFGLLLSASGWAAPDFNDAADDACNCLKGTYDQASELMVLITEAQASGDMTPVMASQEKMMALASATSECFEAMTEKYPEIAQSDELKEKVMSIADQQCPNPMQGFMSMFNPQGPYTGSQ